MNVGVRECETDGGEKTMRVRTSTVRVSSLFWGNAHAEQHLYGFTVRVTARVLFFGEQSIT